MVIDKIWKEIKIWFSIKRYWKCKWKEKYKLILLKLITFLYRKRYTEKV